MSCNIISKCGKDSSMFQNPFLIIFLIHPSYTMKEELVVFNYKSVIFIIFFHVLA